MTPPSGLCAAPPEDGWLQLRRLLLLLLLFDVLGIVASRETVLIHCPNATDVAATAAASRPAQQLARRAPPNPALPPTTTTRPRRRRQWRRCTRSNDLTAVQTERVCKLTVHGMYCRLAECGSKTQHYCHSVKLTACEFPVYTLAIVSRFVLHTTFCCSILLVRSLNFCIKYVTYLCMI